MSNPTPNLTIKQWQPDDRPREKLKNKGAESLSVAELFAVVIGSGSRGECGIPNETDPAWAKKWTQ